MHPSNHLKNILKMGPEPSQNNPKFSLLFWTLLHPSLLQEQPAPSTSTTPASPPNYTYSPVCVLKSKPLSETVNSKLDTLCCAYSFSHDNNWVIAALTDSTGHLLDSAVFAVDEPARWVSQPLVDSTMWNRVLFVNRTQSFIVQSTTILADSTIY